MEHVITCQYTGHGMMGMTIVVYAYTIAPFPAILSAARGRDVTSGDNVIDDVTMQLLCNDDIYNVVAR